MKKILPLIFSLLLLMAGTTAVYSQTTLAGALNFDGADDYVSVNNIGSAGDFSWEAWIKTSGNGTIIAKAPATGGWNWGGKSLFVRNGRITYDAFGISYVETPSTYNDNLWHHVTLTVKSNYSGSLDEVKIYVDGTLAVTRNNWDTNASSESGYVTKIGYTNSNFPEVSAFSGTIEEVRFWNRTLTASDIANNKNCELLLPQTGLLAYYKFNQGIIGTNNSTVNTASDDSGNNLSGTLNGFTLNGTTSNWVAGHITASCTTNTPAGALNFDGANDYVAINNPFTAFGKELTIEWTANIDASSVIGSGISQSTTNVDNMASDVWLMHYNGNSTLSFYVNDNGSWKSVTANVPAGWHKWAAVANATSVNLYMDGSLVATSANGITSGIRNNANSVIHLGKDSRWSNRFMKGNIDEVRIWSRALCAGEILNNVNGELSGTQTGLQEYYKFNHGRVNVDNTTITSLSDFSGNNRTGTLINFALTGTTSNWITGSITGSAPVFAAPSITASNNGPVTVGSTINLTATGTGTFSWKGPNGFTSMGQSPSISNATSANAGTYTVTITQNGCTNTASTTVVVNTPAGGLHFDGGNDKVKTPAIIASLSNFTVEGWVKWTGAGTAAVYTETTPGNNSPMFSMIANSNGFEVVLRNSSEQGLVVSSTSGKLTPNQWTHVAFVRTSATTAQLIINGVKTDDFTFTNPGSISVSTGNIGVRERGYSDGYLNGSVDELRIWNRALCAGEIQNNLSNALNPTGQTGLLSLYQFNQGFLNTDNSGQATLLDASGNNRNGSLLNFALTGTTSNWVEGAVSGTTSTFVPHTATITAGGALNFCPSGSVTFTANTGTGFAYQWSKDGLPINGANTASYTANSSGSYNVTITKSGCTATAQAQQVVVEDLIATVITSTQGDTTVALDATTGTATLANYVGEATATDNCSVPEAIVFTQSPVAGTSLVPNVATDVTLTATDASGLKSTQTFTVTATDQTGPVVETKNITVALDASGKAAITPAQIDNGTTDNSGSFTLSLDKTDFNCSNLGTNAVTLKAVDASGNTNTTMPSGLIGLWDFEDGNKLKDQTGNWGDLILSGSTISNGALDVNNGTMARTSSYSGAQIRSKTLISYVSLDNINLRSGSAITIDKINSDAFDGVIYAESQPNRWMNGSSNGLRNQNFNPGFAETAANQLVQVAITYQEQPGNQVLIKFYRNGVLYGSYTSANFDAWSAGDAEIIFGARHYHNNQQIGSLDAHIEKAMIFNRALDASEIQSLYGAPNAIVTVVDTIAPAKPVLADLTSQCTATATAPTTTDNCSAVLTGTTTNALTYSTQGTHIITWSFKDASGNITTATQNVIIKDITAPSVSTLQDVVINLDTNCSFVVPDYRANLSIGDNCTPNGSLLVTQTPAPGTALNGEGSTVVSFEIKDLSGNTAASSFTLVKRDITAPVVAAKSFTLYLGTDGTGTVNTSNVNNNSSDSCGPVTLSFNNAGKICAIANEGGTLSISAPTGAVITSIDFASYGNATGSCGNFVMGWCNSSLSRSKVEAAFLGKNSGSIGANNNVFGDPCYGTVKRLVVQATYSVPGVTADGESITFNCSQVGNNTVTLIGADASGNVASATATVTVIDSVKPIALAQNLTIQLNANGKAATTAAAVNNGSSDACGIKSITLSKTTFDCSNVGENTVLLTVTDKNGNVSTANAVVTVEDKIAPVALAQSVTIQFDASGNASTSAAAVNNGSTDACGIKSITLSKTAFDCSNVGDNAVVLTVTDVNGNVSTANATVTVQDNIAPTVLTQNLAVQLDASGNASITEAQINNGSTDNCSIASYSLDKKSFDCSNVGNNTVVLTVTDVNGNVSTAPATITVEDNIAPVALAKNISVTLVNGSATITAASIDNGSNDACGIQSLAIDKSSFDCSNLGNNTVVLTVTDVNGNVYTATATVNVIGVKPVPSIAVSRTNNTFTGLDSKTIALGYGAQSVTLTASNSTSASSATTYQWSTSAGLSNATSASPAFTPTAAGIYTFTVTATNEFGCSASTSVTITVLDVRCGTKNEKVLVCHKTGSSSNPWVQICISANAVDAHLKKGSTLGSCGSTTSSTLAALPASEGLTLSNTLSVAKSSLSAYPNPFVNETTVTFKLVSNEEKVSLDLYDLKGVRIANIYSGRAEALKDYSFMFDGKSVPAGVYFFRLTTGGSALNFKVIVTQ